MALYIKKYNAIFLTMPLKNKRLMLPKNEKKGRNAGKYQRIFVKKSLPYMGYRPVLSPNMTDLFFLFSFCPSPADDRKRTRFTR